MSMEEFVPFIITNGIQKLHGDIICFYHDYILVEDYAYQYVIITTKFLNYSQLLWFISEYV